MVSVGFYLCAYTSSLTYLYVCFGVVVGLGNGFGYATPIPVMAKWFPDKRGLAIGLAVGGYGAGSAIFGPLAQLKLIPAYGLPITFRILGTIFLVMTMLGALLLRNPPAGYQPQGWSPAAAKNCVVGTRIHSGRNAEDSHVLSDVGGYALGCSAGLMVISQLVPFAKSVGIAAAALSHHDGWLWARLETPGGRILSGWMVGQDGAHQRAAGHDCDQRGGRCLRYTRWGGNVALLYLAGVRCVLVLRNAALRQWRGCFGFLGHQERGHQLWDSVHSLGSGRDHRAAHRGCVV